MSPTERQEFRRQLGKEYREQHPNQGGTRPFYPQPTQAGTMSL